MNCNNCVLEVFLVNGWIFARRFGGHGTVFFPEGDVAANFGEPGDSFPTQDAALAYFRATTPDKYDKSPIVVD